MYHHDRGIKSPLGHVTCTIQLGQAVGVAMFGSLFLTLDADRGAVAASVSGHALAVTLG